MRNPNGFGSVVKLSGNRRKPFAVRKTVGYNENGSPVYTYLGYFASRKDALLALSEYNFNPYDLNRSKFTLQELYDEWSDLILPKFQKSLQRSLIAAYGHCSELADMPYRNIKRIHMQECIDKCGLSASSQFNIRNLFVKLDEYAFEMDIINKMYSPLLTVTPTATKDKHKTFTNDEIKKLWEQEADFPEVLFMLYTGMRISEAATLPTSCIKDGLITYGMKTKAGKDRIIPIHPAIKHIVDARMNNELLFGFGNDPARSVYLRVSNQLKNIDHLPHDCRHTFRSELDRKNANKVCIDLLMGHSSGGTGERIYTHKTVEELRQTILLVTYNIQNTPQTVENT